MQIIVIESAEKFAEQLRQKLLAWTLDDGDNRDRDEVFMSSLHPIDVPSDAVELIERISYAFGYDAKEIRRFKIVGARELTYNDYAKALDDAAALITAYSRTVPRRMLYEINGLDDDFPQNIDPKMDAIAEKFGYRAE